MTNLIFITVLSTVMHFAQNTGNDFTSKVFIWDQAKISKTRTAESREFLTSGSTNYLEDFRINAITISPDQVLLPKNFIPNTEKLIIVKEGLMEVSVNRKIFSIGAGSVILSGLKDDIKISNHTAEQITFFLLQWKTGKGKIQASDFSAKVIDWNDVQFKKTEKGGVRSFLKEPTDLLAEFEMHVTTLNTGIKSHDPHTHADDEIILVKSGMVEEVVNKIPYQFGEGSFILLNGNEPHGIRNIGNTPCEDFAFRFK